MKNKIKRISLSHAFPVRDFQEEFGTTMTLITITREDHIPRTYNVRSFESARPKVSAIQNYVQQNSSRFMFSTLSTTTLEVVA